MNDIYEMLLENVQKSDIPENYEHIVSLIGLDNFIKICQYAMGDELYFPTPESILRETRNRLILQEYDGYNMAGLSRKYGITKATVKNIVKGSNPA